MRIGENPTKFARHNNLSSNLFIKKPSEIMAATVVYIPHQNDYYKDSFEILKASIHSLKRTLKTPFDLAVFDNGSCHEVIEYLIQEYQKKEIQFLWLSSENLKKIGAWNYIFSSCQAKYIYYFDCDIYHLDGWFEKSMILFNEFPNVLTVNAAPIPMKGKKLLKDTLSESIIYAKKLKTCDLSEGDYIDENWLKKFAISLGTDPIRYAKTASSKKQLLLKKNKHQAFIQSWHAQFLAKAEVFRRIFPQERNWALNTEKNDHDVDKMINIKNTLRLGTTTPMVYHLGNVLTDENITLIKNNLNFDAVSRVSPLKSKSFFSRFFKFKPIRLIILKIHTVTFNLLYGYK